jgi:hypothetical protein
MHDTLTLWRVMQPIFHEGSKVDLSRFHPVMYEITDVVFLFLLVLVLVLPRVTSVANVVC